MTVNDDRVDILDTGTGEPLGTCHGPDQSGACPHADRDGIVACAGYRVASESAGPEYWHLYVPAGCRQCPLSWPMVASY